jgi:hypothetical protein
MKIDSVAPTVSFWGTNLMSKSPDLTVEERADNREV